MPQATKRPASGSVREEQTAKVETHWDNAMNFVRFTAVAAVATYLIFPALAGESGPGSEPLQDGSDLRAFAPRFVAGSNASSGSGESARLSRWGAIAVTDEGRLNGVSANQETEAEALDRAIHDCEAHGGKGCKQATTYRDRCIAIVSGKDGDRIKFDNSESSAIYDAMRDCVATGYKYCYKYHSACSLPVAAH